MGSDFNLRETRNNIVAKDNRMIQNGRYSLGQTENKAILYLISKIQPDDAPGKIYRFNINEFKAILNWSKETNNTSIKAMLQHIADSSWWLVDDDGKTEKLVRWLDIVHLDVQDSTIELSFHRDMFPYVLNLKQHLEEEGYYYTSYKLQNVALMKHRYSPRLYELLKSYSFNNRQWIFENNTGSEYDLQVKLADTVYDKKTRKSITVIPESWKNWAVFKRDVLEPAIKEINRYTDIKVSYEGKKEDIHKKKSRGVRSIEFHMIGKTVPELTETDHVIDVEYDMVEDEKNYHQMSMEELMKTGKEENQEAPKEQKSEVKYPVLDAELNGDRKAGFDEKKTEQLYNAAKQHIVAGEVPFTQWEVFVTDLVAYYYDKIMATKEDTKTTTFRRLLDCVNKDYDGISSRLLEQYGRRP